MLRFAFLTDEFVTEPQGAGGLSSYLDKISVALQNEGVEVEIFVKAIAPGARVVEHNGARVFRVKPFHPVLSSVTFATKVAFRRSLAGNGAAYATARNLASEVMARHRARPFDVVQSTNNGATGLFLRPGCGFRHLVRLSAHRRTWSIANGRRDPWLLSATEKAAVRRGDVVYAPSEYLAELAREDLKRPVSVLRPPLPIDWHDEGESGRIDDKGNYLLHFGQLSRRKGSDLVAKALPIAWQTEPDLRCVWAGPVLESEELRAAIDAWGEGARNVSMTGRVGRTELRSLIAGARASILPSRADSLPNTVIESLALGVGVVGMRDASLPELITHGNQGLLVAPEDIEALAGAMVSAWRGVPPFDAPVPAPKVFAEMEPSRAATNLLALAGVG